MILLQVKTPIGTLVIETDQPEIAGAVITVDEQQKITLETGYGQNPIEFQADEKEHTLKVTKGGFETFTQKFTIKAGESQTITVRLEPNRSAIAISNKKANVISEATETTMGKEAQNDLEREVTAWAQSKGAYVGVHWRDQEGGSAFISPDAA